MAAETMEYNGNDFCLRAIIRIRKKICSGIRYDLNTLTKEPVIWINGEERNTCLG